MKLFAYICNKLKPNDITKQNITKMKTKIFTLLLNKSLLSKLALIVLLLTGGGNCAWGDTVIKTIDFSDDEWDGVTFTQGASNDPETYNDVTFNAKSDSYNFSIADGKLTFPTTNMSSGNYALGFPVTGIVGGIVYLKVYNGESYAGFRYTIKDGGTAFSTSNCGSGTGVYSGYVTKTGLTDSKAYIYIGRVNDTYKTITKIEVSTLELADLATSTFYPLFKNSSASAGTLISDAKLPSYVKMELTNTESGNGNSSSVESPYNFKENIVSGTTYYRVKTGYSNTQILVGGLSHVKSIRLYGNGTTADKKITTSVTKLSGPGSTFSVDDIVADNDKTIVKEYAIDLSSADLNTYYLYTITFAGYFNLWGLYIEAASSCTSVAAPTDLTCSANGKTTLTFSWTAAENASAYTATLYSDSGCSSQVAQTTGITGTSVTFSELSGSTTYYCKVQSNGDGETYCAEGNVTDAVSGTTASKDYTLTVESNNDSYGTASADESSLDEGETTTITAAAESGYKFRSWAVSGTGAELSSTTDNPTTLTMGTANATVTATFSALETYTITYNKGANGTGSAIANGNKTEDVDITLSSKTYTYSGHKQMGWSTTDGGEKAYDLGETYTENANLDLYPYWVETHTITYNGNGGTGYMLNTSDVGEITLRANIYTKTGYTFLGWATSQANADAGIVAYADKAAYTLEADVTLYAVWAESYCDMVSATSGVVPSVGDVISMQSGAFGGAVIVESSGSSLSYGANGFQAGYGATTLDVTLNDYLKAGSIIIVSLYTGNANNLPGYDLYTSDGTKKIDSFVMTEAATMTFQYKVVADDDLDGTNGFKLVKTNPYTIVFKSLNVTDCQPGGVITESGWNTYSSNKALDLSTIKGGTAYVAAATADSKVTMRKCTDIVDAGTGLMIKGTAGETFTIDATHESATLSETNLMVGLPNGGEAPVGTYVFGWPAADASDYGFYYVNISAAALGAGKAYLNTGGGSGARLNITFDDDATTGINELNNETTTSHRYYNLQGHKVERPTKGVYIIDGRKVFVGNNGQVDLFMK